MSKTTAPKTTALDAFRVALNTVMLAHQAIEAAEKADTDLAAIQSKLAAAESEGDALALADELAAAQTLSAVRKLRAARQRDELAAAVEAAEQPRRAAIAEARQLVTAAGRDVFDRLARALFTIPCKEFTSTPHGAYHLGQSANAISANTRFNRVIADIDNDLALLVNEHAGSVDAKVHRAARSLSVIESCLDRLPEIEAATAHAECIAEAIENAVAAA